MQITSPLDESGTFHVSFDIDETDDLAAHYSSMTFCPDHVILQYCWSGTGSWRLMSAGVSGRRRLADGSLGKERKRSEFSSHRIVDAPAWLQQLVGAYRPADRDQRSDG